MCQPLVFIQFFRKGVNMYANYAKIRDKKGLSDYQISKDLGISRSIFSDWKSGRHSPSKRTRFKICQALGLPPVDYFYSDNTSDYIHEVRHNLRETGSLNNRVADYVFNLITGETYHLSGNEYDELQNAIDVFIASWIKAKKG